MKWFWLIVSWGVLTMNGYWLGMRDADKACTRALAQDRRDIAMLWKQIDLDQQKLDEANEAALVILEQARWCTARRSTWLLAH